MGVPQAQIDVMPITSVQGVYTASGNQLTTIAGSLAATSTQLEDKDVKQNKQELVLHPLLD